MKSKLNEKYKEFCKILERIKNIINVAHGCNEELYWKKRYYSKAFKKEKEIFYEEFRHLKNLLKKTKNFKKIEKILYILEGHINDLIILREDDERSKINKKYEVLERFLKYWVDIKVYIEDLKISNKIYEISEKTPKKIKGVLKESIDCLNAECYKGSVVMSRHAYEAALVLKFKQLDKKEPIELDKCSKCQNEINICPHCNKKLPEKKMGIMKLHKWALNKDIIPKQFSKIGNLISEIGASGAHPFIFDADSDDADLSIRMVIFLLKKIKK